MVTPATCTEPGCTATYVPHGRRKTTLCKRHASAATARKPEERRKRSLAISAKHADPTWSSRRAQSLKVARARMVEENHPAIEKMTEGLLRNRSPGPAAGSEESRVRSIKSVRTRLAHIPLAYRDEYRRLIDSQRFLAKDAARIVIEQAERDARRHHEGNRA